MFAAIGVFTGVAIASREIRLFAAKMGNWGEVLFSIDFYEIGDIVKGGNYCKVKAIRCATETIEIWWRIFGVKGN